MAHGGAENYSIGASRRSGCIWPRACAGTLHVSCFSFAFAALSVLAPLAYAAQGTSGGVALRVEGTAEGTGAAAVRAAGENGLLAALGEYLDQYAPDGDLRVFQTLLENPRRYVRSFTRLESHEEDGATVVTLRVNLDEDAIRREAAAILFPHYGQRARVLVIIAERGIGAATLTLTPGGVAGDSVIGVLEQAGLGQVAGLNVLLDEYEPAALMAQLTDDAAIRLLLRENAADAAVVGRAFLQSGVAAAGSNLLEHRAELELRIVGAREGAYTLKAEAKVLSGELERGAQTAMHDACAKVQDDIVPLTVLAAAQSDMGTGVLIAIMGSVDSDGRQAILERLKKVPGVGEIDELRQAPGVFKLYAPYTGDIGPLYRHLTWNEYKGFRLSAERVVAREIRLEAVPLS